MWCVGFVVDGDGVVDYCLECGFLDCGGVGNIGLDLCWDVCYVL